METPRIPSRWFRKNKLPAWLVLAWPGLQLVYRGIDALGNLQFLADAWQKISPYLPSPTMIWDLFWTYGWVLTTPLGLYLLSRNGDEQSGSSLPPQASGGGNDRVLVSAEGLASELEQAVVEGEALKVRLREATTERDRERADKETLAKENAQLQAAVQGLDKAVRDAAWHDSYGTDPPTLGNLPSDEMMAARHRIEELRPAFTKAIESYNTLCSKSLEKLRSQDSPSLKWLAELIVEDGTWRNGYAAQVLDESLNNPSRDVRRFLIGFIQADKRAERLLLRILGLLEWPDDLESDYQRWRECYNLLGGKMEELLARNSMREVRQWLRNHDTPSAMTIPLWPD